MLTEPADGWAGSQSTRVGGDFTAPDSPDALVPRKPFVILGEDGDFPRDRPQAGGHGARFPSRVQHSSPAIHPPCRWFWLLLVCGLALRCVALTQPLVDAHLLRQCQTAAATRDMWKSPGFTLSSRVPWVGDFTEAYVQELPIYNYLTMGVNVVVGHLTLSGKLVSVSLWAISFFLLQGIWRRLLDPPSAEWANLLFVIAPLGVFFGQAVMPEMLVQVLAFGFVLLLARYLEAPTLLRWLGCAVAGGVGLLVKAPEIAHLYLILLALLWQRGGWREWFRPRYLLAGALSAAGVFLWSRYLNSVNGASYAFGTAATSLAGFIGPLALRFQLRPWLMIAMYLGAFVVPGPAALAVLAGVRALRERPVFLLGAWLGSLAFFYLFWFGNAATAQSYYNLPALAPLAALFGLGMQRVLAARSRLVIVASVLLTVGCAGPLWVYLFTPDRTILRAALWARDHTEPGAVILCQATHRPDLTGYGANPVFHYYAERPTFIWTADLPEPYRSAALERARDAVVTVPLPAGRIVTALRKLRGLPLPLRESTDWLLGQGFAPVAEGEGFVAFRRQ